jgi:murein DD-endopeptidase MepM/ murein hydrolase activator NlpD
MLAVTVWLFSVAPVWSVRAGGGVVLRPPFNGTYRVTAHFDHDRPNYAAGTDNYIWIYNGERVASSYANKTGEPYPYDGHDGWDWSMGTGTDVLAAASGTVVWSMDNWGCYGHTIIIDHGNSYYTQYSHLSQRFVGVGNPVVVGQHIAESGNTAHVDPLRCPVGAHLHFGVRHGGYLYTTYATDPFGWRGSGRDPLYDFNQKESSCLWAGVPGDAISCADIIVEDDGAGWAQYPSWDDGCGASSTSWARCDSGNGFRQHWTNVWDPPDFCVQWRPWYNQVRYPGYYQIHAFIPTANSTTSNARYQVRHYPYTTIKPVNQNNPDHFWASLGTYWLWPLVDYVSLYDYTGESPGSRRIVADSIKFSASIVYLLDVRNAGGWTSSIVIRNNNTSSAQMGINYYNTSGGLVSYQTTTIAGNGSTTKTPPSGFSGSAVVVASQDVSVVVENSGGGRYNNYNGVASGGLDPGWGQIGTTIAVPLAKYNFGGKPRASTF